MIFITFTVGCKDDVAKQVPYNKTIELLDAVVKNKMQNANLFIANLDSTFKKDGHFDSETDKAVYNLFLAKKYFLLSNNVNGLSNRYFDLAIRLLEERDKKDDVYLWAITNYAWYCYFGRNMQDALKYYSKAMHIAKNIPRENIIDPINTYKYIGFFLGTIHETKLAVDYLNLSLTFYDINSKPSLKAEILDNAAVYYAKLKDLTNAYSYLDSAMLYAKKANDSLRIAKILGNRAQISLSQDSVNVAMPLLKQDIALSISTKDSINLMLAYSLLSDAYAADADAKNGIVYIDSALMIAKSRSYLKSDEFDYLKKKLGIIRQYNLITDTSSILLRMSGLKDVIDTTDGNNAIKIAGLNFSNDVNIQKRNEIATSLKKEQNKNRLYAVIAVILFGLIIWLFKRYQKKLRKKENDFSLMLNRLDFEKVESEQKLAKAKQDMAAYVVFINERNNQISSLNEELEKQKRNISNEPSNNASKINAILDMHLITEENWIEFKEIFIKENTAFYQRLLTDYPGLTDSNMRIIFLSKLGLSSQEIANIVGVSYDAVKKAKQRLKTKLGVSLTDFLAEENLGE